MNLSKDKKVIFFGCPLDCDEREEAVRDKLSLIDTSEVQDDPYMHVLDCLKEKLPHHKWEYGGSIAIEDWLRPIPFKAPREQISVKNFVSFLDSNGCSKYIEKVHEVTEDIYPSCPCWIGVDHSLTTGLLKALSRRYGSDAITLIILDSHTDALPIPIISDLIKYDMETNKNSPFDPNDPFLQNRKDTINSASFIYHLVNQNIIKPRNICLIGVSDEPPKRTYRIKDPRVKNFVTHFKELRKTGIKFLTKKNLLTAPSKLKSLLNQIDTPYAYISVDMDIGARNALNGVRFLNRQGINEAQIYKIVSLLKTEIGSSTELIGLDFAEFNPRRANPEFSGGQDRTYRIAANMIKSLCFGIEEKE